MGHTHGVFVRAPRRLIIASLGLLVALGAAGAVGLMYFRNKADEKKRNERDKSSTSRSTRSPSGNGESAEKKADEKKAHDDLPGAQRELREFLAGES